MFIICFTLLLVAVVLFRLLCTYFPELDYKWETYYVTTQLSDLNNVTIWLLLPAVISVSIKNMWEQRPHIHISRFVIALGVRVLSWCLDYIHCIYHLDSEFCLDCSAITSPFIFGSYCTLCVSNILSYIKGKNNCRW